MAKHDIEEEPASLVNIGQGIAVTMFDQELNKALENILDVNTDPKKMREIILKVQLRPTEDRDQAPMSIQVMSKLAPTKGVGSHIYIGRQDGLAIAVEHNPRQGRLFKASETTVQPPAEKGKPN